MLQTLFLILLFGVASVVLLRQFSGKLVATPYAHMLYFLFVTYIGGFLLAGQYDLMYPNYIALVGFVTALAAILGYVLITVEMSGIGNAVYRFTEGRTAQLLDDTKLQLVVGVLALLTFGLSLLFFGGLPPSLAALGGVLTGDVSISALTEVRDTRFELTKSAYFGGEYRGQGLLRAVILTNCSILSAYFFARFGNRITPSTIIGVGFAVVFSWIFVGGVGDRAPFLETMIIAVTAYAMVAPVKPRAVLFLVLAFFVLLLFTSLYSTKSYVLIDKGLLGGIGDLVSANIERAVVGNSINDARVIELVQAGRWELRYGDVHFRNFITSIPGVNYGRPVAYELFAYFNPYSSRTTFFSGTYLTAAYLDFGIAGAVALFGLCGVLIGFTERAMFLKREVTGLQFIFYAPLSFMVAKIIIYGPTGLLSNAVVIAVIYVVLRTVELAVRASSGNREHIPVLAAR